MSVQDRCDCGTQDMVTQFDLERSVLDLARCTACDGKGKRVDASGSYACPECKGTGHDPRADAVVEGVREMARRIAAAEESTGCADSAIERAGFRAANNVAHPFLGPTPEDHPTLWCIECGRDSGYHYDECSKSGVDAAIKAERARCVVVCRDVAAKRLAPERWGADACADAIEKGTT